MPKVDRLGWVASKKMGGKLEDGWKNSEKSGEVGRFVATQGDGLICRKIIGIAG